MIGAVLPPRVSQNIVTAVHVRDIMAHVSLGAAPDVPTPRHDMRSKAVNDLRPSAFASHHSSVGCLTKRCAEIVMLRSTASSDLMRENSCADRIVCDVRVASSIDNQGMSSPSQHRSVELVLVALLVGLVIWIFVVTF